MTHHYTYTSSSDFIHNLDFEYVVTYSFQRGSEFEESNSRMEAEYENFKLRKKEGAEFTSRDEARIMELKSLLGYTQYLINEDGGLHPSANRVRTFSRDDAYATRIRDILMTEITEVPMWLCAPEYRDALVFYNKQNEIVSVLNICLSCLYMETKKFNHISADYKTYDLFKRFFIEIGHEVEDPAYFPLDDLNRMKDKFK